MSTSRARGGGIRFALDLDAVAARRDVHAEALLDGDQVAVVVAEQAGRADRAARTPARAGRGPVGDGGEVAAGHQAASCWRICARHAVGAGGDKRDVDDVARSRVGVDVNRLKPRRAADHLARVSALAFDQDLRVAAHLRAVERELVLTDPGLQPLQPVVHDFAREFDPPSLPPACPAAGCT